ncbi:MAG TPA: FAD-binding monooxygenase, partial [Chitinophagaceae bacterium]|nr:FAD-binding monooxygenase [Chitinophagaceae bacterium]
MKIVVIGAGIAGLSCAITLRKAGHEVVIAERYQFFREVGLGFVIMPNGLAALDAIGVGRTVRDNGCMLQQAILQDVQGNTIKSDAIPDCL